MKTLSETWFAEGYIDFELKKYTLLAYLQEIGRCFNQNKLYPQLSDLIFHYNNLMAFRQNKQLLKEQFPKKITGLQLEKLQLLYEQLTEDDELMQELEAIIQFSTESMKQTIDSGTQIYEFVEDKLNIFPIGLLPINTEEGYFFLSEGSYRQTRIYQFRLSFFEQHAEKYRSIKTEWVGQYERNLVNSYELMKLQLIRNRKELPNPAVYSIETDLSFPVNETLLPIAKRSLVRFISNKAA